MAIENSFAPPCPRCKEGKLVKLPETGWTCEKCGYAPFSDKSTSSSQGAVISVSTPIAAQTPPPAAPTPAPRPAGPKTIFSYSERQPLYDRQMWVEAGKGVRFSRVIPLSVLPPGEPIKMEVMVHNAAPAQVSATYYLALTTPNLQGMRLVGETPELSPGQAFDVTQTITTALLPGDYSLTMFCMPHSTDGSWTPGTPPLKVMDGPIPQGLAGLYSVLKVRTSLVCPSCRGTLLWSAEGTGGRPRAWSCGRCGYRLESGLL